MALDAGRGVPVTLVAAPAGYGKTTAVRAWCAARRSPPAWVTLDSGDNDPVRLWTYVATAVERAHEGIGRDALQRLAHAGGSVESAVDALMNGIATSGEEVLIVLDDMQALDDEECLATIDHAVRRSPPAARLVLLSRVDPGLALARLRSRRPARTTCPRAHVHPGRSS